MNTVELFQEGDADRYLTRAAILYMALRALAVFTHKQLEHEGELFECCPMEPCVNAVKAIEKVGV